MILVLYSFETIINFSKENIPKFNVNCSESECPKEFKCFDQHCKTIKNYDEEDEHHCYCPDGFQESPVSRNIGFHHCEQIENCPDSIICDQKVNTYEHKHDKYSFIVV